MRLGSTKSISFSFLKNDFSFHATLFPEQFGQFARIDTRDARYFFFFQPFAEAFHGIPMTVIFGVIRYDDGFGMDFSPIRERLICRLFQTFGEVRRSYPPTDK